MKRGSKTLMAVGAVAALLALSPVVASIATPQPAGEAGDRLPAEEAGTTLGADGRLLTGMLAPHWGADGRILTGGFLQRHPGEGPHYGQVPAHLKDAVEAEGPKTVYLNDWTGDTVAVTFP
jgi:hypothetical protein